MHLRNYRQVWVLEVVQKVEVEAVVTCLFVFCMLL